MDTAIAETTVPAGFTRRADGDLLDAHNQWASRSPDEAVYSIDELLQRTKHNRDASRDKAGVDWSTLYVKEDACSLQLAGRGGVGATFTNWSLSQLCALPAADGRGGIAPVSFISKLSTATAVDVLNERLQAGIGRTKDANLLVSKNGRLTLRSITTEAYERVWDYDLAQRLASLCERGGWGPAEAFKRADDPMRKARTFGGQETPLPLGWVGDRSMFVCLVDYDGVIHSDGNTYARFFLLSNSEVGAASLKVTFGLLDFVCCNFILWGCTEVYEASFKHTKSIHDRWNALSEGFSRQLSADNRQEILDGIAAARALRIDDTQDAVIAKVRAATDLSKALVASAYDKAEAAGRYGDPRSVWGMVNGLTEVSQTAQYADQRTAIDLKASRLMGLLR